MASLRRPDCCQDLLTCRSQQCQEPTATVSRNIPRSSTCVLSAVAVCPQSTITSQHINRGWTAFILGQRGPSLFYDHLRCSLLPIQNSRHPTRPFDHKFHRQWRLTAPRKPSPPSGTIAPATGPFFSSKPSSSLSAWLCPPIHTRPTTRTKSKSAAPAPLVASTSGPWTRGATSRNAWLPYLLCFSECLVQITGTRGRLHPLALYRNPDWLR
jgi:hypothetical protein